MKTGIIDEPVNYTQNEDDKLGINDYAKALTNFIENTETPMTIGIQGEWGSGKTSLMNLLWKKLEGEKKNTKIESVWINTWEHSLLKTPEETLISIVGDITNQISNLNPNNTNFTKLKDTGKKLFTGAAKFAAGMASGVAGKEVVEDILDIKADNSIKELKNTLENFIKETVEDKNNKDINNISKLVFYIDDLDRIEPKDAVKVLELLKNIFSLPYCVFILAIDYQVVIKGLKDKFGDLNEDNEREFRSFFDKIIQLPFMMPLGTYNTSEYLISLLTDIDFISDEKDFDRDLINQIMEYSIGSNPRAIKRLVNNLSLMNILEKNNKNSALSNIKNYKIILFYIVCCQVAYPKIYDLIILNPDIENSWDESLAFEITQKNEEKDEKFFSFFEDLKKQEYGDDDWEQCLYRICYADKQLRRNFFQLVNFLKLFVEDENIEANLEDFNLILNTSSTTAVTAQKKVFQNNSRIQENFEGTINWITNYFKNSNQDQDLVKERIKTLISLHDLLKNIVEKNKNTEIKYTNASIALYLNNRKILGCYNKITKKLKNSNIGFSLPKDPKQDFKIPLINNNLKGIQRTKFNPDNVNVWKYSDIYELSVSKKDLHENTDKIEQLIIRSIEIIENKEQKLILKTKNYTEDEIKKYNEMSSDDYFYEA